MDERPELLTRKEVAEWLGVSPPTVSCMAHEGRLPYSLVGKRMRFRMEDVRRLVEPVRRLVEPVQMMLRMPEVGVE